MRQNRVNIINEPAGVRVCIGPRRNGFLTFFLILMLAPWTLGGALGVAAVLGDHDEKAFLMMWLCFWLFMEVWLTCACLWNALGREKVYVGEGQLTYRREVCGGTLTKKAAPTREVSSLRAVGPFGSSTLTREQLDFTRGAVEVAHRDNAFSIGYELERWEAAALVEAMSRYLPETPNNGMHPTRDTMASM
jgi:hypothetical protein